MIWHSFDNANGFHRAMRSLAGTKAGRVIFRRTAHRLDRLVSKLTGGRDSFAGLAAGLPTVILTTTGAKSGKPRTVALLGIPHPTATVTIEGNTWDSTARLATPGEREEIWANGVELYPGLTKERVWAGGRQSQTFILQRR